MLKNDLNRLWDKRRALAQSVTDAGQVHIIHAKTRIQVAVPFNDKFVAGARELSGRYRERAGVWSFSNRSKRLVVELCKRVYGEDCIYNQTEDK